HAVRTTFSYIDQVQSMAVPGVDASLGSAALPSVSISQKQETVGTFLTLVPDAQPDGRILLSIAYDNTVAQPIKSITFGEDGNQVQVQQITIDGNGTVQQVALSPGQPVILSGLDRRQDEYDRRRLSADAPLLAGGQDRASPDRMPTIVVVTAQVADGSLLARSAAASPVWLIDGPGPGQVFAFGVSWFALVGSHPQAMARARARRQRATHYVVGGQGAVAGGCASLAAGLRRRPVHAAAQAFAG